MFKLELSEQVINVILGSLSKQPLEYSFEAFVTIKQQMAQQMGQIMPPLASPEAPKLNGSQKEE